MLCARECPDWCIYIDSHKETVPPAAPGGRERSRNVLDRFAIDFSLCMYCGICIEVCPFDALFWSPEFEYAETDIHELTHETRQAPRVDVDRPGPARPRPRRRGAEGDRRRPQDGREARRRERQASGRADDAAGRDRSDALRWHPTLPPHTHGFLSPTGVEIAFVLVGLATFGAALVTVTTRQLVHAALWLVVTLGGLAVEYLLLTAEFIAWVQVLIYVGSVVVLLLFGLMLTKAPIGRSPDADSGNRWAALARGRRRRGRPGLGGRRRLPGHLDRPATAPPQGSTEVTGASLFRHWVLPFEALSVLLLAALVGAIVLSRKASGVELAPVTSRAATGSSPASRTAESPRPGAENPASRKEPADAPRLSRRPLRPPLLHRPVRRPRPPQRDPGPDVRRADAQRRQPQPGRLRRLAARDTLHSGQALTLFTIAIAAAEIGIGLAIVLLVYRNRGTSDIDRLRDTAEGRRPGDRRPRRRRRRDGTPDREGRGHRVTTTTLAVLVPLLPFLGAAAGLLLGRHAPGFVRPLAVLPTARRPRAGRARRRTPGRRRRAIDAATELTPTGSVPIDLALHIDGFAALVAVLVGLVATCVQIYSTAYLRDDPRYPSYAALVSLFTSAMLLVVYSGDLIVLLVGWEIMGICSYFLVGHYWETPEARAASIKAFLVTKLGDVPFLIGLFALATDAGSFRITKSSAPSPTADSTTRPWSPCCSSPASPASPRSSRCTPGSPTRWRAPHPSPR